MARGLCPRAIFLCTNSKNKLRNKVRKFLIIFTKDENINFHLLVK